VCACYHPPVACCLPAKLSCRCRVTTPESTTELRDEGLCLYALERYSEAAESLEQYLELDARGPDHTKVWCLCVAASVLQLHGSTQHPLIAHSKAWPSNADDASLDLAACSCDRFWRGCDGKTLIHRRIRRRPRPADGQLFVDLSIVRGHSIPCLVLVSRLQPPLVGHMVMLTIFSGTRSAHLSGTDSATTSTPAG
jgi:hypothetical protein